MQEEEAIFLDVRYPEDFALGHLPGAVNIPLRRMPSAQIEQAIKSLNERPIVAACYDKRSCFYSLVAGLRLSRAGYDFRGRYTTPPRVPRLSVRIRCRVGARRAAR